MAKRSTGGDGAATWIVTLAPGTDIDRAANALATAGLDVTSALAAVGVIVGTAPKGAVAAMRKVKGVANVAPDREVSVGLPDDPETW